MYQKHSAVRTVKDRRVLRRIPKSLCGALRGQTACGQCSAEVIRHVCCPHNHGSGGGPPPCFPPHSDASGSQKDLDEGSFDAFAIPGIGKTLVSGDTPGPLGKRRLTRRRAFAE